MPATLAADFSTLLRRLRQLEAEETTQAQINGLSEEDLMAHLM